MRISLLCLMPGVKWLRPGSVLRACIANPPRGLKQERGSCWLCWDGGLSPARGTQRGKDTAATTALLRHCPGAPAALARENLPAFAQHNSKGPSECHLGGVPPGPPRQLEAHPDARPQLSSLQTLPCCRSAVPTPIPGESPFLLTVYLPRIPPGWLTPHPGRQRPWHIGAFLLN